MKRIISLCLLVVSGSLYAQQFEGIIKFGDRVEIGGAQKTQELEDRVKAPLLEEIAKKKKKLENPSLSVTERAKLEAEIKRQEDAVSIPLMTNVVEVHAKNDSFCILLRKGTSTNLILDNGSKVYDISHLRKTYEVDSSKPFATFGKGPEVKKTAETMTILDRTCTKYLVKSTEDGKTAEGIFWVAEEIKNINWKFAMMFEDEDSILFSQIEGLPLKVEITSGTVGFYKDVFSIENAPIADTDFEIPAGYQELIEVKVAFKKKKKR